MAKKTLKNWWGWKSESLIEQALLKDNAMTGLKRRAEVHVHLGKSSVPPKAWKAEFPQAEPSAVRLADGPKGLKILLTPRLLTDNESDPRLKANLNVQVRDGIGSVVAQLEKMSIEEVIFDFALPTESLAAAILGLEIALYRFKRVVREEAPKLKLTLLHASRPLALKTVQKALCLGQSVNLARHLVNVPPNWLNPESYAQFTSQLFAGKKGVKIEVWDESRLKRENMNLHLAVGQGSNVPPCLVHIRYRGAATKNRPIAFVGKGITFDSGGLDIKPSSGMRLMKKDMGGSAACLALAHAMALSNWKGNADFYLALAENSVSGTSFRPSDVITARNGLTVEIHNTDAEGRLVMADAMDLAIKASDKPTHLIDVATLTGAIKVALGSAVAGLFSNNTKLAADLMAAGQNSGDLCWAMPLVQKYRASLSSHFADMVNASDGFGGAITAALFLEKFVGDVPWAHFDIYAWKDSAEGAWLESGGSGQGVLALAQWLKMI